MITYEKSIIWMNRVFGEDIVSNCDKEEFLQAFKHFYKHFMMWNNMNDKKWNQSCPGTPNYRYVESIRNLLSKTVNYQNNAHQG